MPTCAKCKEEKPLDAFRVNGAHPDGSPRPRSICKACGSQWKTENKEPKRCPDCRLMKPASEFPNRGLFTYCKGCRTLRTNAYKKGNGREAHNARMVRYNQEQYENNPEHRLRTRARNAVHLAVAAGLLKKPERCPKCKRKAVIHGHHHNGYDKEHWLDVVWLCARCHRKEETRAE